MLLHLVLSIQFFFNFLPINASVESEQVLVANDSTFKTWLKDSLNLIESNLIKEKKNCLGLNDIETKVGEDSLSLEILKQYELAINPKFLPNADKNVKYILELLKSYDELPNKQFSIRFITSDYYSPSSARSLVYDKLTEIKELKVTESSPPKVSSYTYIRGRLNDKKVIEKTNGKDVVKQYNFIWKDDHLIKQEL